VVATGVVGDVVIDINEFKVVEEELDEETVVGELEDGIISGKSPREISRPTHAGKHMKIIL